MLQEQQEMDLQFISMPRITQIQCLGVLGDTSEAEGTVRPSSPKHFVKIPRPVQWRHNRRKLHRVGLI